MTDPLSIAILAGGKSSRMGTDKALIQLPPDDKTILQTVVERVQPLGEDVFIVASDRPQYAAFGVPVRPDFYPDAAVLGGIGSALRHARFERCLIVSCDHPLLNHELLAALAAEDGDWDILIPTFPGESRQGGKKVRQTLHAIYRTTCIPAIERSIAAGNLQIVSFFGSVHVREIDREFVVRFDPELRSFFSVNTPEALEIARSWLDARAIGHTQGI